MRYKIVRENKPTLTSYGKYKAKTVHNGEVGSDQIVKEAARISHTKVTKNYSIGLFFLQR